MTKIAAMPIEGQTPYNIFYSGTKRPIALGLGMLYWGFGSYQVCTNDESGLALTIFMARPKMVSEYDQEIPQSKTADNPLIRNA